MRIQRIVLRNFRGVVESNVVLATDGVTVVEGPNEVGKSSLAEAIDLILENRDSSTKAAVKAVKPRDADEGTEVELELTTGGYHVVYTKRWHTRPQTTLKVLAPAPENHTGQVAHERMIEILADTLDDTLWKALRYQQGTTIAQAALGDSPSLAAALDVAASGTALGGEDEADLWKKVGVERAKYFTPGGKPAAERMSLTQKVTEAKVQVTRLRQELDQLDAAAERHRQLRTDLNDAGPQLTTQHSLVDGLAERTRQLEIEQREVDALASTASECKALASVGQTVSDERHRLIEELVGATEALQELQTLARREAPGLESANNAVDKATERRDGARRSRQADDDKSRDATSDYEHFRELLGLELLVERQERVQRAEQARNEAETFLESCAIDSDKLAHIQDAFIKGAEARARLTGESPSVRIEAIGELEVTVGKAQHALAAGQVIEERATTDLELVVANLARVTIVGGTATIELHDAAARADQHLAALYRSVGVSGDDALAQTRALEQRRLSATDEAERADQALHENLRDLTPQLMAEKIVRASKNTGDYREQRSPATSLPVDLDQAKSRHEAAVLVLGQATQLLDQREEELSDLRRALESIQTAATQRDVRIQLAGQRHQVADQGLAVARGEVGDDDLAKRLEKLYLSAAQAEGAHREAAGRLVAEDPDSIATRLKNATNVLKSMDLQQRATELELTRVKAELDIKGEEGLQDQLDFAESKMAHLERDQAQRDRRAGTVELLYMRLGFHRDAARRSRLAPFRNQIVGLGRIVFGTSFSVELNESLQVENRTLNGVTVPYGFLSSGAKEQLCIISRLACAALVNPPSPDSPDTGVPVIIDDALGNSDPARLECLGAVLAMAGRQSQVIILTCTPERYRNVGSATVVRLDRQLRRPTSALAANGNPAGPAQSQPQGSPAYLARENNGTASLAAPLAGSTIFTRASSRVGGSSAQLILDCLHQTNVPLGKREILTRSGMSDDEWPTVIATLMEQGLVCRDGRNKGARYRLAASPELPPSLERLTA